MVGASRPVCYDPAVNPVERILERARAADRRVAFPEATDPRVLRAARRLADERVVRPLLIGDGTAVRAAAAAAGVDLSDLPVEEPARLAASPAIRERLESALGGKVGADELRARLADPLYLAAALVRGREADGTVAGAVHTTADTLRAALTVIRPAPGVRIVSSFFLMVLNRPTAAGEPVLAFADAGLVPDPDPDQLAEIAARTAHSFRRLVEREPRVALLGFSTLGSARHPALEKVREARRRLARMRPDFEFDGELQADAALVPEVARAKAPDSPVAGQANVLVFPDLNAGNIAYKLVERLAGAQAVGPLLQGLDRPANDLSRGCGVDDIVVAAAVTAVQAAD